MKKLFYSLLCLLPFLLNAEMTLQECINQALKNNEQTSISELQIMIAGDRLDEVWGMALPHLSGQVDYIASGEPRSFLRKHKTLNAKASLIVPIYNFGGASNLIKAQGKLYEASFYSNEHVRQELINAVTQAYFRLLEAYRLSEVVKESITTLKEQFRISQDFFAQGLVHANESTLVAVQLAQREQDQIQAEQNIALATARLNRLMAVSLDSDIDIVDTLEEMTFEQNITVLIELSCAANPALAALKLQVEAAFYSYQSEKGYLYPSIYAFSDYSSTNAYALPYTQGVNVGIGVQMTFYDGSIFAKISRKEKEWLELKTRFCALKEDIELQIRSSFFSLESAKNRIPIALKSVSLAEQNLKMTQDQYQEGLVNLYDLLADEERLAGIRSNYLQALYHFHRAKADLEFAAGFKLETSCETY